MESHVVVRNEIRAAAYKRVMKGEDHAGALRTSWMDLVVKERFFCDATLLGSDRHSQKKARFPTNKDGKL